MGIISMMSLLRIVCIVDLLGLCGFVRLERESIPRVWWLVGLTVSRNLLCRWVKYESEEGTVDTATAAWVIMSWKGANALIRMYQDVRDP